MKSKKQKIIDLGGVNFKVIDLTEPLKENTEVYPGDPKPKKEIFNEFNKLGYEHYIYTISDHNFHPHGDAPKHQNPDSHGFEVYDIDFCFNNACLIDLSDSKEVLEFDGMKYLVEIKKEHLKPFAGIISKKGAIVIRTGYDKWIEANKIHNSKNIPYLTKDAADFLSKFENLKVVGIDSLTVDPHGSNYIHQKFKNKLIVESLVNLHSIPEENRLNFDLQTSPITIVGATGGPIKAYAFIRIN